MAPAREAILEGRKLNGLSRQAADSLARPGVVTYSVAFGETAARRSRDERGPDARTQTRARTRFRSAKVLDANNAFLCEALVHDRSADGMRLMLARNVGLPVRFGVYDDETGDVVTATLAWGRGATLGLRIQRHGPPSAMKPSERQALGSPFYGVRD